MMGSSTTSSPGTNSPSDDNLVICIPSDLPHSDCESFVLAKGLTFVPNFGPIDIFCLKENTEVFFRAGGTGAAGEATAAPLFRPILC